MDKIELPISNISETSQWFDKYTEDDLLQMKQNIPVNNLKKEYLKSTRDKVIASYC